MRARSLLPPLIAAAALAWTSGARAADSQPDPPPTDPAPPGPTEPPPASPPVFDPVATSEPPPRIPPPEPPREPSGRDNVAAYYTGLHIGVSPGFLFPVGGGKGGFVLSGGVGWGFDTGSVMLVPELETSFIFASDFLWTLTPGAKIAFPISIVAPYVAGGAGPGWDGAEQKWGAALRAAVGFTVHPTPRLALGLGAQFETITGTDFRTLGPILTLSF